MKVFHEYLKFLRDLFFKEEVSSQNERLNTLDQQLQIAIECLHTIYSRSEVELEWITADRNLMIREAELALKKIKSLYLDKEGEK